MKRLLRRVSTGALITANLFAVVLFLLSAFTHRLHPADWWFAGFMGLLFPYLLLVVILFLFFWLLIKPSWSLLSLGAILAGLSAIRAFLPLNLNSTFSVTKEKNSLRIMNWNIRRFTPFYRDKFNPSDTASQEMVVAEIEKYQPDVICFQEFFSSKGEDRLNMLARLRRELGYPYHVFSEDTSGKRRYFSGTAIFSRKPILEFMVIEFPGELARGAEPVVRADIMHGKDTVRVFTIHLQSFGFGPRDYSNFSRIRQQQDTGLTASRNILRKMQYSFTMRGQQADFVQKLTDNKTPGQIICGDFNDVPNSYAYRVVRGDRKDAFLEKGSGFGKTFTSTTSRFLGKLPTLRIDYILTSPELKTIQFSRINRQISDHQAQVADIQWEGRGQEE